MDLIDKHIINRSTRAIKCLYLNSNFYQKIKESGLSAEMVFAMKSKYISKVLFEPDNEKEIEENFLWLIKIGILRREVDGQGLTSKVRITPLGRSILKDNPELPNQKPSIIELITNWIMQQFVFK